MIEWLRDERCGVALDASHDPVVISTWEGRASMALVDRYFQWADRVAAAAMASEQQLVQVVDFRAAQLPSAEVRKRFVDHSTLDLMGELSLATVVVLGEHRMGGLMRAASGLGSGLGANSVDLFIVDDIDEALELALLRLREARIPAPVGLDPARYQTPLLS